MYFRINPSRTVVRFLQFRSFNIVCTSVRVCEDCRIPRSNLSGRVYVSLAVKCQRLWELHRSHRMFSDAPLLVK